MGEEEKKISLRYDDDDDLFMKTKTKTKKKHIMPYQSNNIDKRTTSDIFYNQNILSTTALTIARDIDGGMNTRPLERYNTTNNNNNNRNKSISNVFQKTYKYGSKSISRSEFSKEMLGDDKLRDLDKDDDTIQPSDLDAKNYYIRKIQYILKNIYTYYNKHIF